MRSPGELKKEIESRLKGYLSRDRDGIRHELLNLFVKVKSLTIPQIHEKLQEQFQPYAANFPIWANQSSGMLQLSIWSGLRELGIGANLQHYNPVIDGAVKSLFDIPESYHLVAQMPFGGIGAEPDPKEKEEESIWQRNKLVLLQKKA